MGSHKSLQVFESCLSKILHIETTINEVNYFKIIHDVILISSLIGFSFSFILEKRSSRRPISEVGLLVLDSEL